MVSDEKYFGITPPRSIETFTESDISETVCLVEYLDEVSPLESSQGDQVRQIVIGLLRRVINEWCYETAISLGASESLARETRCALVSFGSYKLGGLIGPNSDMDLVCICPSILTVDAFFTRLVAKLIEIQSVGKVVAIPTAFTPIIKLTVNDIEIDLLFSRISKPKVDLVGDDFVADEYLCGTDQRSARALNGPRVAAKLLRLVPNLDTWRTSLRAIKHWANSRQIYSNVTGYFGGIAWAICVARVCQLYPNMCASQILPLFYKTMLENDWETTPIQLNEIEHKDNVQYAHFQVWNKESNRGLMPILTPAFPCQNATDPVTLTTKRVILDECKRALDICNAHSESTHDDPSPDEPATHAEHKTLTLDDSPIHEYALNQLFSPISLPTENYIEIHVSGKTEKVFNRLKGFVELKLRSLIYGIEKLTNERIQLRPFPEWTDDACMRIAYTHTAAVSALPDLRPAIDKWMRQLAEWNERDEWIGIPFDVQVRTVGNTPPTKKYKIDEK